MMNRVSRWCRSASVLVILASACGKKSEPVVDMASPPDVAVPTDLIMPDQATPDSATPSDLANLPPVLTYVSPLGAGAGVTPTIYLQFSQPMDTTMTTVSLSNATLGTAAWSGSDTVFAAPVVGTLTYATTYTITVAGKSKTGGQLTGMLTPSFVTQAAPDTTPPTISVIVPADAATDVSVYPTITLTFSEPIAPSSLVASPGSFVWTVSADGLTATGVRPTKNCLGIACVAIDSPLLPFTSYTLKVAATDLAGNALGGKTSYTFTTGASPLTDIKSTTPLHEQADIAVGDNIIIEFTKPVDFLSLNKDTIDFFEEATPANKVAFAATLSVDKKTATLNPTSNLKSGIFYDINILPNAIALDGDLTHFIVPSSMKSGPTYTPTNYLFAFSTSTDTTRPTVISTKIGVSGTNALFTLVDGAAAHAGCAPENGVFVTFSEAMGAATSGAFQLKDGSTPISTSVVWDGSKRNATINAVDGYQYGKTYTLEIDKTTAVDRAVTPNSIAASGKLVYTFTTLYAKEVVLNADTGDFAARTVYLPAPPTTTDQDVGLYAGERNYYQSLDQSGLRGACAFLNLAGLGSLQFACAAIADLGAWQSQSLARAVVSFTLPDAVLNAPGILYGNFTGGDAKATGDLATLGPIVVESVYAGDFKNTDLYALAALADPAGTLVTSGGKWMAAVRAKVEADVGRKASQGNHCQLRVRLTTEKDSDLTDDLIALTAPKLTIGYLSTTP